MAWLVFLPKEKRMHEMYFEANVCEMEKYIELLARSAGVK